MVAWEREQEATTNETASPPSQPKEQCRPTLQVQDEGTTDLEEHLDLSHAQEMTSKQSRACTIL